MATSIGFYLSAVIAAGIIFIGGRFLLAPSSAATAYGVPAGAQPHSRAYLSPKGIRAIAAGLFAPLVIRFGSAHALGWVLHNTRNNPLFGAAHGLAQRRR